MNIIFFKKFSLFLLVSFFFSACSISARNNLHEYDWDYVGETGPQNWHKISSRYLSCIRNQQSPIDITDAVRLDSSLKLKINYSGVIKEINKDRYSIYFIPEGENNIVWNDDQFNLLNIHIHIPSEHQLDGQSYPLEVHLVHQNKDGKILVFAVLYEVDAESELWPSLLFDSMANKEKIKAKTIETSSFLPQNKQHYYLYEGSLTTPPCIENVIWIVFKEKLSVSSRTIKLLKAQLKFKSINRPIQDRNNRVILEKIRNIVN